MDFQKTVSEIMTTDLTTVGPKARVEDLVHLFKRRGFHHLPVENKDQELVGIISTEDVERSSRFLVTSDNLLAEHIMTPYPITIECETTMMDAVNFFLENQVRALPVVDWKGNFVGLITPYDMLKELSEEWEINEELKDTEDYV